MSLTVVGLSTTLAAYERMRDAGAQWSGVVVSVGSNLPYARPIEEGRTRNGRWVRKAGPARYLRRGIEAARSEGRQHLSSAVRNGPSAVEALKDQLNGTAVRIAQEVVPVRRGGLRSSIRSMSRGR